MVAAIASAAGEPGIDAIDLAGKSVVIAGRLESLDRRTAVALVRARGGTVRRGLGRHTGCLVIGHDVAELVASGHLQAQIAAADRAAIPCLSENRFVRILYRPESAIDAGAGAATHDPGATAAADIARQSFSADDIAKTARLPADMLRLLSLLDFIELDRGLGDFTALAAARQAARLLAAGTGIAELIESVGRMRRSHRPDATRLLARYRFDLDERRRLALRVGDRLAEADGQLRLALPETASPAVDELMAAAASAEAERDWPVAEALYRRCSDLAAGDPTAPFNLGNVLRERGRPREAALFFEVALARDNTFAAAWYNLGHLAEAAGDIDLARDRLERALHCDPAFADAAFNLARLHYTAGVYDRAMAAWRHYLDLDPDSEWARRARRGIALCRQHLRAR